MPQMTKLLLAAAAACAGAATPVAAFDNGAARTPVLGWSTWNGFYMNFNASLVRRTAAAMKSRGLLQAGFSYLSIGGSTYAHPVANEPPPWHNLIVRNATGFVQIDPGRFPGPGSNLTMCENETLLKDCLGQGAKQKLPQECGCVDGNAGMKKLIADLHSMGFLWGSYSNEAGCQVAACNTTVLNRSKYEGFVRQDRALYIDDWESDYLMIDSVGQTVPKSVKDRTAWNRAYMTSWAAALERPNPVGRPVVLHSCHNVGCTSGFTGPTLAVAPCNASEPKQWWHVPLNDTNDNNNQPTDSTYISGMHLRQTGSLGLCVGCTPYANDCANTANPSTDPGTLGLGGLGIGMQACIEFSQHWNFSLNHSNTEGAICGPHGNCLALSTLGEAVIMMPKYTWERVPRVNRHWTLRGVDAAAAAGAGAGAGTGGHLVVSANDTSLCLAEGPWSGQLSNDTVPRPDKPMALPMTSGAKPFDQFCPNSSNMWRSSTDILQIWGGRGITGQLESMVGMGSISRPGAWAFPDCMELGVPGDGVLTWEESKAHLALYAVTSSPLILGNDPREGFMQQRLVDLLLNPDMLRVNQLWAGFAGDRVWSKPVGRECWAKPLGGLAVAVVLFNRNGSTPRCTAKRPIEAPCNDWGSAANLTANGAQSIELEFDSLPRAWLLGTAAGAGASPDDDEKTGGSTLRCAVFDIFATPRVGKALGSFTSSFVASTIPPHGVKFLKVANCSV